MNSKKKREILKQFILKEIQTVFEELNMDTVPISSVDIALEKFPSLKPVILDFFTPDYKNFITDIFVVAPKPTTFKIILNNRQFFFLTYSQRSYTAKIAGKKYYLMNLGESERAIQAVADLLTMGNVEPDELGPEEEVSNEPPNKGGGGGLGGSISDFEGELPDELPGEDELGGDEGEGTEEEPNPEEEI